MEPLSVAVHVIRLAGVRPGQSVLVQGSGTIGLLAAATARSFGARSVIIADINQEKLAFARGYVDCFTFASDISLSPEREASRLKEEAQVDDIDIVLECTGAQSSAQTGLYALAPGGIFVQVGMGKPEVTLPLFGMFEKELILKMSFRYGPGDYEAALELLAFNRLSVKPLISSIVPFRDAAGAWETTKRGEGIKNLIEGVEI